MNDDEYLTQAQLADLFHVSTKTLEAMRQQGTGPSFYKFGRRVVYSQKAISEYLAMNKFRSTSEYN